jgi:hypothetical protein
MAIRPRRRSHGRYARSGRTASASAIGAPNDQITCPARKFSAGYAPTPSQPIQVGSTIAGQKSMSR